MKISAGQEFGLTLLQPLRSGQGLALGPTPIVPGIIWFMFVVYVWLDGKQTPEPIIKLQPVQSIRSYWVGPGELICG